MECKVCGKKLFRTQKFCPDCGTKVEDEATQNVDTQKEEKQSLMEELEVMKDSVDKKEVKPEVTTPAVQPNTEPQPKQKSDSYAITGFVLALCGTISGYIGLICGILGIVFSSMSLKSSAQKNQPKSKLAIAGLIVGIVFVALTAIELLTYDYYIY